MAPIGLWLTPWDALCMSMYSQERWNSCWFCSGDVAADTPQRRSKWLKAEWLSAERSWMQHPPYPKNSHLLHGHLQRWEASIHRIVHLPFACTLPSQASASKCHCRYLIISNIRSWNSHSLSWEHSQETLQDFQLHYHDVDVNRGAPWHQNSFLRSRASTVLRSERRPWANLLQVQISSDIHRKYLVYDSIRQKWKPQEWPKPQNHQKPENETPGFLI